MKPDRTNFFIAISSLALVAVLLIQVNWLLDSARIKEELFNEKANLVLARTTDAVKSDPAACRNLEVSVRDAERKKIDSLFRYYMKFYNFHIDYRFEIRPGLNKYDDVNLRVNNDFPNQPGCYKGSFDEMSGRNGFELKLFFPQKEQFIRAEMGIPFVSSVVLILVVLFMFWRTVQSLLREKKISEQTSDFLNNMTHEFKTPLTNIALAGKMMTKDSTIKQEEKIKHYSEIILQENEKLRLQVEQVLSMSALERGEIPLQKTELNFHELIKGCIKSIGIQIENKLGNLKFKADAERYVVIGDKTHLANAVCNLIDNALKYSNGKPEIFIETFNSGNNFNVMIADNGMGIEGEYQEKVFDKYFRVPTGDVHDVKGFGMGLAYVKKIIDLHEGKIELRSEKGRGTTFSITLPNA